MTAPPFFVVGHPRSGTTLLRLILNEHSHLAVPSETTFVSLLSRHAPADGGRYTEAELDEVVDRMLDKRWMARSWVAEGGLTAQAIRAAAHAGEPTQAGVMDALLGLWMAHRGKRRWGDKVPRNYRHVDVLDRWFPDCRVVHIVRDGRDVAVSCLTPPFAELYDLGNVYEVALRWRDAVRSMRAASRRLGPQRLLELRYEDLTTNPEPVVRQLCDFLDEPYEDAMLGFHRNAQDNVPSHSHAIHPNTAGGVNTSRIERWRRDADEAFVAAFEGLAEEELLACGYTLSGFRPSPALRARIAYERLRPRRSVRKNYRTLGDGWRRRMRRWRRRLGADPDAAAGG